MTIRFAGHVTVAAAVAAAAPLACLADDGDPALSWEVAAVSDYLFRGVSQTRGSPTLQAGLRYAPGAGLYVGAWASGTDSGPGKPHYEVDYFMGHALDIGETIRVDLLANRYTYPDIGGGNYNELIATTTLLDTYSVALAYTNDVWGSGTDSWYHALHVSWPWSENTRLDIHLGRTCFSEHAVVGARDYTDWGVSVSRRWGLLTTSLGYYGTDGNARGSFGKDADSRVMLSIGLGN